MTTDTLPELGSIEPNQHGYRDFVLGKFSFSRDEYFAHVRWPNGTHMLPVDEFLRAIQRDVAWGFFYGIVNFDTVMGTVNHYGTVDLFAGRFNAHYRQAGLDYSENFKSDAISRLFEAILADWTNTTFDPFASPAETADGAKYKAALGHGSSIFLVRPDGYVGLAAGEKAAARELTTYRDKWITPA